MPFEFKPAASLEEVPEKYRSVYVESTNDENETVYVVGDNYQGLVGDYVGSQKALADERGKTTSLKDENAKRRIATKAFEDLCETLGLEEDSRTADGLKSHIENIADQAKNGKELKINLEKVREEMSRKHSAELASKDEEISKRDHALAKHLINDVATREIAAAKGNVKVLLTHVKNHCKVVQTEEGEYAVRVLDSAGDVRYNGAGEPMSVANLVTEIKEDKDFAGNFESETRRGTGAQPGAARRTGTVNQNDKKTSVDKISAGLSNR